MLTAETSALSKADEQHATTRDPLDNAGRLRAAIPRAVTEKCAGPPAGAKVLLAAGKLSHFVSSTQART